MPATLLWEEKGNAAGIHHVGQQMRGVAADKDEPTPDADNPDGGCQQNADNRQTA